MTTVVAYRHNDIEEEDELDELLDNGPDVNDDDSEYDFEDEDNYQELEKKDPLWGRRFRFRAPRIRLRRIRLPRIRLPRVRLPRLRLPRLRLPRI